jgi:hypothetical protein
LGGAYNWAEPPFRFGQVVAGEYFVGRAAEIASLTVDLRTATNVVLISPRRYGKTSLVLRVRRALEQEGSLVAYIDLLRTPSMERFASHIAAAISDGLLGRGAQALQRATEWFTQLRVRPRITLNQDGTPSFEFTGGAASVDVDATIEHLLGMLETVALDRKRRVVVVFDEFQEVLASRTRHGESSGFDDIDLACSASKRPRYHPHDAINWPSPAKTLASGGDQPGPEGGCDAARR